MIVRKGEMRASKAMQNRVINTPNIELIYNSETLDILGKDGVEAVIVKNTSTNEERTLKVSPIILESFKDANSGGYTPTEIRLMPDGNYKLVGEQGKFPTQVITPAEYKAGIVNKVLNTTTKINQVKQPSNTPETRLPKDIKQTKMQPKATKPKPY